MKLNINKKIEILILSLVFVLPFNFRYILNFADIQNLSFFSESLKYSLYLFDILFLAIFSGWIFQKIKNKTTRIFLKSNRPIFLLIIYLSWNTFYISSNSVSSSYNYLRLLEVLFFFLILIETVKSKKLFDKILYLIFVSGVLQTVIALFQFIFQKSLGLKYLGESILRPDILGVAKLEVHGEKFIRSYGTFPHPNVLGVFLFLSLIAGLYFILNKKSKIPFSVPSFFKKINLTLKLKILSGKVHFWSGLILILIGILVSFSRSIWLVTALVSLYLIIRYLPPRRALDETRKYLFTKKLPLKSRFKYIFIILLILITLLVSFYKFIPARFCSGDCQDQSLTLRSKYAEFSRKEILHHNCWTGIGLGQFSLIFKDLNPEKLPSYNIQPVHNLYLLVWSEIGLIGLIFLFLFIKQNFKPFAFLQKQELFILLISGFLLLGFFDHYFWSLPQGQFIFWLALALLATSSKIDNSI